MTSMWIGVAMAAVALAILVFRGPGTGKADESAIDAEMEELASLG